MPRHRLITTALVAGLAFTTTAASATTEVTSPAAAEDVVRSIEFTAEPGAFPVDDRSGYWTDAEQGVVIDERFVEGLGTVLRADGADEEEDLDYFRLELLAPGGVPLTEGEYTAPWLRPTADQAGLVLISGGVACSGIGSSTFTVRRLDRDETGSITALDVDVDQHCRVDGPAFRAHLHVGE